MSCFALADLKEAELDTVADPLSSSAVHLACGEGPWFQGALCVDIGVIDVETELVGPPLA